MRAHTDFPSSAHSAGGWPVWFRCGLAPASADDRMRAEGRVRCARTDQAADSAPIMTYSTNLAARANHMLGKLAEQPRQRRAQKGAEASRRAWLWCAARHATQPHHHFARRVGVRPPSFFFLRTASTLPVVVAHSSSLTNTQQPWLREEFPSSSLSAPSRSGC